MESGHAIWNLELHKSLICRDLILKLNNAEVKEQQQVKISDRLETLENLNDNVDVNRAWENIRGNIKTSAKDSLDHYKLKWHKFWFYEECSKLLGRRKQAKLQWLQRQSLNTLIP
jgi:hypothetical protein